MSPENPDPEKIRRLGTFINNLGYSIKIGDEIHPKELQKLLGKIEGSDEENLIARLTLRSMKRASYTTECVGHFGLAAKYYCHFTSPIRRYPDLQIHRIIKENLHGGMSDKRSEHFEAEKVKKDVKTSIYLIKMCYETCFFSWKVCQCPKSPYLCNVFFIVLDLRLTKVGVQRYSFFYALN